MKSTHTTLLQNNIKYRKGTKIKKCQKAARSPITTKFHPHIVLDNEYVKM